jgi:RHS repeat-associated protein
MDRFGRVTELKWQNDAATTIFDDYQSSYDRVNNVVTKAPRPTAPPTGKDEYLQYDGKNRLKDYDRGNLSGGTISDAASNFNQHWTALESAGNWRGFTFDADGGGAGASVTQTRTINNVNEISTIANSAGGNWITPTYDAAGDHLSGPKPGTETARWWYTYDAWNRLVKIQNDNAGVPGTTLVTNAYDGLGRRTVRTVTGGTTYHYYYDENWRVIEVRYNAETAPRQHYVWDPRYIDAAVVRFRAINKAGTFNETLYYAHDPNNNVTALIDASHVVQERYTYDAYGKPNLWTGAWATRASSSFANELMFAGYWRDLESGLYHVRNRVYHPTLGAWLQRDPLRYHDGPDLYEYVRGNPFTRTDPSGLTACADKSCHAEFHNVGVGVWRGPITDFTQDNPKIWAKATIPAPDTVTDITATIASREVLFESSVERDRGGQRDLAESNPPALTPGNASGQGTQTMENSWSTNGAGWGSMVNRNSFTQRWFIITINVVCTYSDGRPLTRQIIISLGGAGQMPDRPPGTYTDPPIR